MAAELHRASQTARSELVDSTTLSPSQQVYREGESEPASCLPKLTQAHVCDACLPAAACCMHTAGL